MKRMILALLCAVMISTSALPQEVKYLKIGSLHSWFRSDGSEPWQGDPPANDFQYGLQWPADERSQDCLISKGLWIGTTDYRDHAQYGGKTHRYKVVHCGPRHADPKHEFIPVDFKLAGRFPYPQVSVDGLLDPEWFTDKKVDIIDPHLPSDLMLINVVNTSIGVTMTRKIMAWSHAEHDNYYIYDYTFTNSGNIDADPEIEKQTTLQDVWFYFQYRYAPSKEPVMYGAWLPGSAAWGRATMLDVRGEDPSKGDPFRALFAWLGKHSQWQGPGDNIGAPDYQRDGHFSATQYLGVLTLHADKSPVDHADDLSS